jgi:pSer/pThr/pTyr-binding forkhead associated (FHA) protein
MGLLFFAMIAGGLAGFAGWAIVEPSSPGLGDPISWQRWEMLYAAVIGAFIGCAIGAVNGWYQGSKTHLVRGGLIGLLIGAPGGLLGLQIGGQLFASIAGSRGGVEGMPLPMAIFARTLAFLPFGAMIGAVLGAAGLSWKRVAVGALGGAVGGILSGMSFDLVAGILGPMLIMAKGGLDQVDAAGIPRVAAEVGGPSRAILAILLGMSIGLFTAMFARLTRTAWIRLVLGRNEGKEWIVDAAQTFIGRNEKAHVPLFGDMNIAPMHACIQRNGPQYLLVDGGSQIGTFINGQRISQAPLFDGAVIQIGPYQLIFSLRAGAARKAAEAAHGAPMAPAPQGYQQAPNQQQPTQMYNPPSQMTQQVSTVQQTVAMPQPMQPAPQSNAPRVLHAVDGPMAGRMFSIENMELGRESGPIPLAFDTSVSRKHVRFSTSPIGVELADLGSTNGTFVNGQRITITTIRQGDLVKIGVTTFRVE